MERGYPYCPWFVVAILLLLVDHNQPFVVKTNALLVAPPLTPTTQWRTPVSSATTTKMEPFVCWNHRLGCTSRTHKSSTCLYDISNTENGDPETETSAAAVAGRRRWYKNKWSTKLQSMGSNTMAGMAEVHNHYLDLFQAIGTTYLKCLTTMIVVFVISNRILGATWIKGVRVGLEHVLAKIGVVSFIPVFLAVAIPLTLVRHGKLPVWPPATGVHMTYQPPGDISFPLPTVLVAPVVLEEFVFRFGLYQLWYRLVGRSRENHDSGVDSTKSSIGDSTTTATTLAQRTRRFLGKPSTWILISSILFSATHLTNSMPGHSVNTIEEGITRALKSSPHAIDLSKELWFENQFVPFLRFLVYHWNFASALLQLVATFIVSSRVLGPIYLKRGFLAAVGAHLYWNFAAHFFTIPQIVVRLVVRMFRRRKSPEKKK